MNRRNLFEFLAAMPVGIMALPTSTKASGDLSKLVDEVRSYDKAFQAASRRAVETLRARERFYQEMFRIGAWSPARVRELEDRS